MGASSWSGRSDKDKIHNDIGAGDEESVGSKVLVCADEKTDPMEILAEIDGVTGLKYWNPTRKTYRGIRI